MPYGVEVKIGLSRPPVNHRTRVMTTQRLTALALLGLTATAAFGQADPPAVAEVAKLKAQVNALEAENAALRTEVANLKGFSVKAPAGKPDKAALRRLLELEKALGAKPDDPDVRKEAAELATHLAPDLPGNQLVWSLLLKAGVLKDGMAVKDAQKLLGPATDQSDGIIGWYFNPGHRLHVAPYLYAKVTKDELSEWKLNRR
jgi:hypothetical protein